MPEKDCIDNGDCAKCKAEIDRRINGVEKELCAVTKPEQGALAKMHEKINKGFDARPKWVVFWSIVSLIFALVLGSYAYTYNISKDIQNISKEIVTKQDLKTFKEDLDKKLDGIERRLTR